MLRETAIFFSLLLLCSCVATPRRSVVVPASKLPADVTLNKVAGGGGHLIVTLQLESGEELPVVVDTGAARTLLARSLERKLGNRLGTAVIWGFDGKMEVESYASPKFYLGGTELMTDSHVFTCDFKQLLKVDPPFVGVLGMDCLQHYCIQLDFEAGKMRFLDADQLNVEDLGKAFPLAPTGMLASMAHQSLVGGKDITFLIDTGVNIDGILNSSRFWQEVRDTTNRAAADMGKVYNTAFFPECVWNNQTYTNLLIQEQSDRAPNAIGLRFLARHLVTFNFPKRTMYLKQTSIGPVAGDTFVDKTSDAVQGATKFIENAKEKGDLPGWTKNHDTRLFCIYRPATFSKSYTFNYEKSDDSSIYHYRVIRASEDGPWKLQEAWRTDRKDRTIEEYPVP